MFASRTYFAYVSYYYIPSFPVAVILIVIWVVVSLCSSILKQRETLTSPGKEGLVKIKSEVRVPLPADLYSSRFYNVSMS